MGQVVLVIGKSGSGKSASLRNFGVDEVGVFGVAGKLPPFRKRLPFVPGSDYGAITSGLLGSPYLSNVVDDAGYAIQLENISRSGEKGYEKFTDMAKHFVDLITTAVGLPPDNVTYFMMHPEIDERGEWSIKTVGKLLNEKVCIEGFFSLALTCEVRNGRHVFVVGNDGSNLAKAPMGMFNDTVMDNDLKAVDTTIREYYGLRPNDRNSGYYTEGNANHES